MSNTYRERLMARFGQEQATWPRFRAAPLTDVRHTFIKWRPLLAPTDERPAELDSLRRALPACLDSVGRDVAVVLDARADIAKGAGIDGPGLRDLVDRRDDCTKIAGAAAQVGHAADSAARDVALILAENNERALAGLSAAYHDPATQADERDRIAAWIIDLNSLAEMTAHRSAAREREQARKGAAATSAVDSVERDAAVVAAIAALTEGKKVVH